jgi:hypothetical protein
MQATLLRVYVFAKQYSIVLALVQVMPALYSRATDSCGEQHAHAVNMCTVYQRLLYSIVLALVQVLFSHNDRVIPQMPTRTLLSSQTSAQMIQLM